MPNVAIIGTGLIGQAFAMVFGRAGWNVALFDPVDGAADAAHAACGEGLRTLAAHGLCDDPDAAHRAMRIAPSLAGAVEGAVHIQENGPEDLGIKTALFGELDRCADPESVIASSTSALRCSLFTEGLAGRHRCLVAHPVNPPHLVPLVELCGAPWTAPETMAAAQNTMEAVGQAPITVTQEIDGFVLNRLQGALLTEAFKLVAEGVVTPRDLDRTLSHGLGRRWAFMGPFETIELNAPGGIDDYCARYHPFYQRFAETQGGAEIWSHDTMAAACAAWGTPPAADDHAAKTARRNTELAALAAHFKARSGTRS